MDMPVGTLLNLIAIEQYKDGAIIKCVNSKEEDFDELMEYR